MSEPYSTVCDLAEKRPSNIFLKVKKPLSNTTTHHLVKFHIRTLLQKCFAGSSITPILQSPGLYFDPSTTIRFYRDSWNVVTHINIISLDPHLKNIERLLNETTTICNKINLTSLFDCNDIATSTQILLESNFAKSSSLSHLLSHNTTVNTKLKRSIELGGKILKFFFGTLDADDARKYDSAIESSQKNEHEIFHLMKENMHIVKSSINAFNSTISKLNSNEIKINLQLEHMTQAISQVTKVNEQLTYMSRVNNLVNVIESSLLTISNYLDSILNAILFSKANILHPSILSPMTLYHELTANNKNANTNSNFPVPVTIENIHSIIDISKLTSYYFNKKMVFVLSILLTYPERYVVYKSLPLPVPHEIENPNTFSLIHPTSSYIAISDNKMHYTLLDDLNICTTVNSEYSICPLLTIYSSISNPCCETRLFTEIPKSLPKECDSKLIFGDVDIWHVLNNNKWIFVQSKPCHLTVKCNDNIEDYSVSGTGILKLTDDCVGFSKTIKLLPSMSKDVSIQRMLNRPCPLAMLPVIFAGKTQLCDWSVDFVDNQSQTIKYQPLIGQPISGKGFDKSS
ncbi:uncharacterized protein LOC134805693 [Cydia splendana]|uniref:uncharacterized protein LOC134805693 n=1 Tax=Cydia splendana TaxID=1100963 RepID=UPI00300C4CCC